MQKSLIDPRVSNLPRVRQLSLVYCGPAVCQMLLGFLGIKTNQREIVRCAAVKRRIWGYGMNIREIAKAAKRIAPKTVVWVKRNATIYDLYRATVTFGYPVGVEWQGIFDPEYRDDDPGHWSVVTRINRETQRIWVADPYKIYAKRDRIFAIKTFLLRWWDTNEIVDRLGRKRTLKDQHLMFVIVTKGTSFPKRLGMRRVYLNNSRSS